MAEVVPFRGISYDAARLGGLDNVVAPPYDVISPADQDALYAASPYNYVRVILNRCEPGDEAQSPYSRAAGYLNSWIAEGVLLEEPQDAFYHYRQEFTNPADGRRYSRNGLFCGLKLEPYSAGIVLPHEETRTKAKEDRLRLMRVTRTNPEPIYALHEDEAGITARMFESIERGNPDLAAAIGGDLHEIRRITDPETIRDFQEYLAQRRVWIADGHHRYETALTYRDEQAADTRSPAADYVLTVLSAFEDPGLVVLPTHRLVRNVPESRMEQLLPQLERYFDVTPSSSAELAQRLSDERSTEHLFGLVLNSEVHLLALRDEGIMDRAVEGHSTEWKRLDVSILQALVLERSLGIPASALATTPDVGYTRDWAEAFESVNSGAFQAAFLLANPSSGEVRRVAAAGDKMPPKSTFFYPKLWSGLVLRRL